jgi:hypothetical protein
MNPLTTASSPPCAHGVSEDAPTPAASDVIGSDSPRTDVGLVERVLSEYREMPGLALTLDQARRLWGCDDDTCRRLADSLVNRHVLRWSRDGRLVRAN